MLIKTQNQNCFQSTCNFFHNCPVQPRWWL